MDNKELRDSRFVKFYAAAEGAKAVPEILFMRMHNYLVVCVGPPLTLDLLNEMAAVIDQMKKQKIG